MMIASVDGCRGGWIVAVAENWPCNTLPRLHLCVDFEEVYNRTLDAGVVVVDMPIGMPSGPERRLCDQFARGMLAPEGNNTVFLTPPRDTLNAATPEEFQALHREIFGFGAGLPVWGLVPKLREVDGLMTQEHQARVLEFHPELTWRRLYGDKVVFSKHKASGVLQRYKILKHYIQDLSGLSGVPEAGRINIDDLFDVLVGLSVASYIQCLEIKDFAGEFCQRLPSANPKVDKKGLRMEMWY